MKKNPFIELARIWILAFTPEKLWLTPVVANFNNYLCLFFLSTFGFYRNYQLWNELLHACFLLQVLSAAPGERREVSEGGGAWLSAPEHSLHRGPCFPLWTLHPPQRSAAALGRRRGMCKYSSGFGPEQPPGIFCSMSAPLTAARVGFHGSHPRGGVPGETRSRYSACASVSPLWQDSAFHQRHRARGDQPHTVSVSRNRLSAAV